MADQIGCCEIDNKTFEPPNLNLVFGQMIRTEALGENDTPFYAAGDIGSNQKVLASPKKWNTARAESQHN